MDHIRKAIERTIGGASSAAPLPSAQVGSALREPLLQSGLNASGSPHSWGHEVALNAALLESNRIISHDVADPRSRSFDMLRTQVLQTMAMKSWQVLGITSPTPGCGKSTIAINLALSIARQPNRSVLLVDMDLQKPHIAKTLGLKSQSGIGSVLEGKTDLSRALVQATINDEKILVLPCRTARLNSSAWMASQEMAGLMQQIRREFRAWTVIVDLPPILMSDDVIAILSQIDCMLFVAAAGATTIEQVKECTKHLDSASIVRVVLNKTSGDAASYHSRYGKYYAADATA
jgi:capsular exopolysaccharide synthesis family protein